MDFHSLIEDYIEGRLSEETKKAFENAVAIDPELKKALEIRKGEGLVFESLLEDNIRSEILKYNSISQADNETRKISVPTNNNSVYKAMRVAAAILILAIVTAGLYVNQIYSDHALTKRYTDLPNLSGTRGIAKNGHWYDSARLQFEQGHYDQCIAILATVSSDDPEYRNSRYLLAYSLFSSGKYNEANKVFEEIIESKQPGYQRAEFHLILSDLGAGQYQDVTSSLDHLTDDPDHPYHAEAVELKRKLQSSSRKILVSLGIQ